MRFEILCRGVLALSWIGLVGCPEPERSPGEKGSSDTPEVSLPVTVEGGFNVPESVLHDTAADVYLVSNIGGSPFGEDGQGFISRVSPGGEIKTLKWIDGAADGVTLNAPKGMAIVGNVLYVTDVTVVRKFDRETGKPLGDITVEGASFLNDLTAAEDGTLYVSDTGLGEGFTSTGTDAIFTINGEGEVESLIRSETLSQPNGLLASGDGVIVVNWAGGEILRVKADGSKTAIAELPAANLDGVVADAKGRYLVSSWEGACIYRVTAGGETTVAVGNLKDPADLGFDARRERLLVPLFNDAKVMILAAP